jgi:limonene-1,2-epoxide hydrolase
VSEAANKQVVGAMWQALYQKDWDGLKACLAPECHYEDVPTPDAGATGPENVVRRLRIGLDHVARFEHDIHRTIAEGDSVLIEHTETWHFEDGGKVVNHFVTVHEVQDGKITLWRDYWDLGTMMGQAPPWWIEAIAKAGEDVFS